MFPLETNADTYKHTKLDYHATVREMPSHERPRERLQHFGPQALSLAELLAIILRTGTRGDNALDLANKLLSKYGGLPGLVRADFRELCAEHGMGEAKSAQVKAALEIGRRLALVQPDTRYRIRTPAEAANLVMLDLAYLDTEQMRILLLDAKGQLVEKISSYQGTANSSVLRAAEIFRPAIIRNRPGPIIIEAATGWATRTVPRHPNRNRFLSRPNSRSGYIQSYACPVITKGHITLAWTG